MKKITFIAIVLFCIFNASAQDENFEGIIKYISITKRKPVDLVTEITATFKYPYILVTSFDNQSGDYGKRTIYNFAEGKKYELRHMGGTENLTGNYQRYQYKEIDSSQQKTFELCQYKEIDSSQHIISFTQQEVFLKKIKAVLYREKKIKPHKFWYAENLFFNIDKKYALYGDIPLFTNGKNLGLGITNRAEKFDTQATKILLKKIDDQEFALPKDYEKLIQH